MSQQPPSFTYFYGDHIKSHTQMSAEVFGACWRLQCYQFEHGHIPVFPDERARVAGVPLERWDIVWARMADKFVLVTDDGKLGHPRMNETRKKEFSGWKKHKRTSEKRKSAGKKGAFLRWQNDSKCHSKTIANLEKGEGKRDKGEGDVTTATAFSKFWAAVHIKVGKRASEVAFGRAVKRESSRFGSPAAAAEHITDSMAEFAASPEANPGDRRAIHPATWLNQGRYDDDRGQWRGQQKKSIEELIPDD